MANCSMSRGGWATRPDWPAARGSVKLVILLTLSNRSVIHNSSIDKSNRYLEEVMKAFFICLGICALLIAATVAAQACPAGYHDCGNYCCPG